MEIKRDIRGGERWQAGQDAGEPERQLHVGGLGALVFFALSSLELIGGRIHGLVGWIYGAWTSIARRKKPPPSVLMTAYNGAAGSKKVDALSDGTGEEGR